ncbi:MAG: DUF177 domain-containing protein [Rhodospirillales bacterium]|nr:DUF177 domain-containing protein [Rhodospirillales bacterium]
MNPEFTIPINIAGLPPSGLDIQRTLEEPLRQRLADRLAVKSLEKFAIDISIRMEKSSTPRVAVDGSLEATVLQSCSVTLELIVSKFSIPVSLIFEEEAAEPAHLLEETDAEGDDPPEPMIDGQFDVGDTLVQLLAVEINPFPRKPGVSLDSMPEAKTRLGSVKDSETDNPFAALAALKDKLEDR